MGNGEPNQAQIEIMPIPYFEPKKQKNVSGRETTRERPTLTPAGSRESSKLGNLLEKARREVDLSSSYLEDNSKPGLNRSLRLLSCQRQHICTTIYMFTFGGYPVRIEQKKGKQPKNKQKKEVTRLGAQRDSKNTNRIKNK